MMGCVRPFLLLAVCVSWMACAPPPKPVEQPKPDPTAQDWYPQTVDGLAAINKEADGLFRRGKFDESAALVAKGQPLASRLLEVPRPTLAAMEACSDLDDLYGRMLLRNRHYDWASSIFQKNVIRWKAWKPQTEDTARRLKAAKEAVAECERMARK